MGNVSLAYRSASANRKNKAHFFHRVTCPPRCLSRGRLPGRAVAGRWDQRSASALIHAGRKEAERARGQRAAQRPPGLERAVTWDGRGASEDGKEWGAAHLPARGIPAAGQGPAGRCEAYRALFKAHLDDALVERIREATNGNYALGDRRFQAEIKQAAERLVGEAFGKQQQWQAGVFV